VPDEAEVWLASGRGILLMRAFLDDLRYEAGGRKAILTLNRDSGLEKRQHPRQALQLRVQVAPIRPDGSVDWDAAHDAVARDLSAEGMGLLQAQLSQTDWVLLGVEVAGRPLYLPAQVRHCRQHGDMVELGCSFLLDKPPLTALPEEELRTVEASVAELLRSHGRPAAVEERRDSPRQPYTERIEVVGPAETPVQAAFARDLSHSGIAFISTAPLPLEDRILCLPRPGGPPLRLRTRIVRCARLATGLYDVGARFLGIEQQG
jgi:hypothetical protein